MKLVCSQSDLNTHLSLVSRAVPSRPSHPVLANVLVHADFENQTVNLTAFDESLGIRTSFTAQVTIGGRLTLPAKLLGDIISRLPEGELTLDDGRDSAEDFGDGEGILMTLQSVSGRYQMRGIGADQFPQLPQVVMGTKMQLPAESLINGLQGSLFAASTDETKQVLTGVHLSMQTDLLEFAATDGHRLAVVQTPSELETEVKGKAQAGRSVNFAVTLPGKTLRELERILASRQSATGVTVQFDENQAIFEWGSQRITSRLLQGTYPDYRRLLPSQFARQLTVERRSLLAALERISVLADPRNNVVKLTINAERQQLALSVEAQDIGSGQEILLAQVTGESVEIAFNVRYLVDGLKALNASEVQIQMNNPTQPVIILPLGNIKMTYLIMPVQIRS